MRDWLRQNRPFLGFVACLALVRTAVADWNPIPSGSMRPTLLEGDVVLVNRLAYDLKLPLTHIALLRLGEPQRGDVVTFYSPTNGVHLIKRLADAPQLAERQLSLAKSRHARVRVLEPQHGSSCYLALCPLDLTGRDVSRHALEFRHQQPSDVVCLRRAARGVHAELAHVGERLRERVHRVREAALLAHLLEQARGHSSAKDGRQHAHVVAALIRGAQTLAADHDVALLDVPGDVDARSQV